MSTPRLREPAVAGAVLAAAWGTDNALSRALADCDPGQVVLAKSSLGASCALALAVVFGEAAPTIVAAAALLAIGACGYGLSLRFLLLAQRRFGAARTGSVFACAPFLGALGALVLGDRSGSWLMAGAGGLMALGVWTHLAELHEHEHQHEALERTSTRILMMMALTITCMTRCRKGPTAIRMCMCQFDMPTRTRRICTTSIGTDVRAAAAGRRPRVIHNRSARRGYPQFEDVFGTVSVPNCLTSSPNCVLE